MNIFREGQRVIAVREIYQSIPSRIESGEPSELRVWTVNEGIQGTVRGEIHQNRVPVTFDRITWHDEESRVNYVCVDAAAVMPLPAEVVVRATEEMVGVRLQSHAVPDFPESLAETLERANR